MWGQVQQHCRRCCPARHAPPRAATRRHAKNSHNTSRGASLNTISSSTLYGHDNDDGDIGRIVVVVVCDRRVEDAQTKAFRQNFEEDSVTQGRQ